MDWKKLLIVFCAVAGLAGGAGSSVAAPSAPVVAQPAPEPGKPVPGEKTVELGQDFTLSSRQTANVATRDLTVRFRELVSDSRCRPGLQCFWAGDAVVSVVLAEPGRGERTSFDLHTAERGGKPDAKFNAFRVELVAVSLQGDEVTLKVSN